MARGSNSKVPNIKGNDLVADIVRELSTKGSARLVHLGLFRVISVKGRSRYDFKKRAVVPMKPYKQIMFTPARGIRAMLRDEKLVAARKVATARS